MAMLPAPRKAALRPFTVAVAVLLLALNATAAPLFPLAGAVEAAASPGQSARGGAERPLVLVVLLDALPVDLWLAERPTFSHRLASGGGLGLLTLRTVGPHTPESAHLTLGAGSRSRAGDHAGLALDADEPHWGLPAEVIFRRQQEDPGPSATLDALSNTISGPDTFPGSGTPADRATGPVFHLGIAQQITLNADQPYGARPGQLGQQLKEAGLVAGVIGNSDIPGRLRRYGALLAMDAQGVVPFGRVGSSTLTVDPGFPFGPRSHLEQLETLAVSLAPAVDVLFLELGDLSRLDAFRDLLASGVYKEFQRRLLWEMDAFLERLGARLVREFPHRPINAWLISPSPPEPDRAAGIYLSAVAWGPLRPQAEGQPAAQRATTLLYSSRTRRPGLLTPADVTAGIMASARGGLEPGQLVPASHITRHLPPAARVSDAWSALGAFYRQATTVNRQRLPILRSYILFIIGLLLSWSLWSAVRAGWHRLQSRQPRTATLGSAARNPGWPRVLPTGVSRLMAFVDWPGWLRVWRQALLLVLMAPLALLLLPLVQQRSLAGNALVFAALTAGLSLIVQGMGRGDPLLPFIRGSQLTAGLLCLDVLRQSVWMKNSLLGYDPILGSRFYGIGNEYMGILIGSLLMGSTAALDAPGGRGDARGRTGRSLSPRALAAVVTAYAAVAFLLLWPGLGANVGGFITGFVALGVTGWRLILRGRQPQRPKGPALAPAGSAGTKRRLVAAGVPVVLFFLLAGTLLAAVGFHDAARPNEAAHLGQFTAAIGRDGWQPALDTATRKIQTNLRLFRYTIWSRVLVLTLAISAWLLLLPPRRLRRVFARRRFLALGIQGSLLASLVAFLVNDSGVVAAATTMIPAIATLVYLVSPVPEAGGPDSGPRR